LSSGVFGVGWSLGFPAWPKVVGGWFEKAAAGTATGIYSIGLYVGAGLATAVTLSSSWRTNLVLWGLIAFAIAFLWWVLIRDPIAPKVERSELRKVIANKHLWLLTIIFFFGAHITFYTLTGWLPSILSVNAPSSTAAITASLLSFVAAPATLIAPVLSNRLKRRKPFLLLAGAIGAPASYVLFSANLPFQVVAVALLGLSLSTIFVICLILPSELVGKNLVGSATGVLLLAYAGGIIGPWLSGVTQDLTGSFAPTMLLLIIAFGISAALALLLPETGGKEVNAPPDQYGF
jgi:cyanate permease